MRLTAALNLVRPASASPEQAPSADRRRGPAAAPGLTRARAADRQ